MHRFLPGGVTRYSSTLIALSCILSGHFYTYIISSSSIGTIYVRGFLSFCYCLLIWAQRWILHNYLQKFIILLCLAVVREVSKLQRLFMLLKVAIFPKVSSWMVLLMEDVSVGKNVFTHLEFMCKSCKCAELGTTVHLAKDVPRWKPKFTMLGSFTISRLYRITLGIMKGDDFKEMLGNPNPDTGHRCSKWWCLHGC